MAEKLSDKLKGLFKRADVYLGKAIEKAPKSSKAIGPSQTPVSYTHLTLPTILRV